jgi:hypothetical protein
MVAAMTQAEEERKMWELVEERGITYLMTQLPDALIGYCMILQMGADLT